MTGQALSSPFPSFRIFLAIRSSRCARLFLGALISKLKVNKERLGEESIFHKPLGIQNEGYDVNDGRALFTAAR